MWDLQYNFSSLYRAEAITPTSLDKLYNSLAASTKLLDHYLLANTAGVSKPEVCGQLCRKVHLCAIPNLDTGNFRKCFYQASMAVRLEMTLCEGRIVLCLGTILLYLVY